MLKIKDNVNLKELEKFGFKKQNCPSGNEVYIKTIYEDGDDFAILEIFSNDREIFPIYAKVHKIYIEIEFLFDLIQAGLVEKVEE